MKSNLIFKHIKHNTLKYTVAFSAAVHLIGIFMFPSWGTVPDLLKERVIKIKTIVDKPVKPIEKKLTPKEKIDRIIPKPKKLPDPIIPKIKRISSKVKNTKSFTPSPAQKRLPVPIHHSKEIFQPAKAIQQSASVPHPIANLKRMVEITVPSKLTPNTQRGKKKASLVASSIAPKERRPLKSFLNARQTNKSKPVKLVGHDSEIPSPHLSVQRQHFTKFALNDPTGKPSSVFVKTPDNIAVNITASIQIKSPTRLDENFTVQSPALRVKSSRGNKRLRAPMLTRAQIIHPVVFGKTTNPAKRVLKTKDRNSYSPSPNLAPIIAEKTGIGESHSHAGVTPTTIREFASAKVASPTVGIHAQSPQELESSILASGQRVIPLIRNYSTPAPGKTGYLQMASIPSGFSEELIEGNTETHDNISPGKNNMVGNSKGISADQMGKIKKEFSSQIWTKIAQSKYYPRLARKRGFEGEPVVAFTIGEKGNLLKVTLDNGSAYNLLDRAAIDAVKSASPYPPIPEPLNMKTIRFKLPISFILEEP